MVMFYILCGRHPFLLDDSQHPAYDISRQLDGDIIFDFLPFDPEKPNPFINDVSEAAKDLIMHMICADPDDRYTIAQARSHCWFDDYAPDNIDNSDNSSIGGDTKEYVSGEIV